MTIGFLKGRGRDDSTNKARDSENIIGLQVPVEPSMYWGQE